MLAELERLTGLESTYVTSIDWERATQRITRARNVGMIDIPQGLTVDWSDTVCRIALEQGVPLVNVEGHIEGSSAERAAGPSTAAPTASRSWSASRRSSPAAAPAPTRSAQRTGPIDRARLRDAQ
jgi:diguanylate cyclase